MSFLLECPLCGPREVYEFRYGGEIQKRPPPGSDQRTWAEYLYGRTNIDGVERAWWFHRTGCRRWFQAERDTRDNRVIDTAWTLPAAPTGTGPGGAAATTRTPAPASAGAAEPGTAVDG
jgi:heterotetrameric sarcosine oxidase delta subunit